MKSRGPTFGNNKLHVPSKLSPLYCPRASVRPRVLKPNFLKHGRRIWRGGSSEEKATGSGFIKRSRLQFLPDCVREDQTRGEHTGQSGCGSHSSIHFAIVFKRLNYSCGRMEENIIRTSSFKNKKKINQTVSSTFNISFTWNLTFQCQGCWSSAHFAIVSDQAGPVPRQPLHCLSLHNRFCVSVGWVDFGLPKKDAVQHPLQIAWYGPRSHIAPDWKVILQHGNGWRDGHCWGRRREWDYLKFTKQIIAETRL